CARRIPTPSSRATARRCQAADRGHHGPTPKWKTAGARAPCRRRPAPGRGGLPPSGPAHHSPCAARGPPGQAGPSPLRETRPALSILAATWGPAGGARRAGETCSVLALYGALWPALGGRDCRLAQAPRLGRFGRTLRMGGSQACPRGEGEPGPVRSAAQVRVPWRGSVQRTERGHTRGRSTTTPPEGSALAQQDVATREGYGCMDATTERLR